MPTLLLHLLDALRRHLLPDHLLPDVLLPSLVVADRDQDAGGDVDRYTAAEDDGCEREGSDVVRYRPGAGPEGDLEERVTVQQYHNRNKKSQRKSIMRGRLMRLIKTMTPSELLLMMLQFLDLFWGEYGKFLFFDVGYFGGLDCREVAIVGEFGEGFLAS